MHRGRCIHSCHAPSDQRAFAALGLMDFLKTHAGYALNRGAPENEIKEIANIVIIPGGFPHAIMASQAIFELDNKNG